MLQSLYGALVGILFIPQFHLGSFYTTPEEALVIGNLFSYLISPKYKVIATVKQKIRIAPDVIDFLFPLPKKLAYSPGQYMEWTLPHKKPDSRGNRRYITIASSPTEDILRLGVRFYPNGSSFKKALMAADTQIPIIGAQMSGDFVLPENRTKKLVFIAGGIGITPFRSMIKYLIDMHQSRPIVLLYSNRLVDEIVYYDVFTQAQKELGIKTVYTLTDVSKVPENWQGRTGRIDASMITQEVADFQERTFYLSGPHAMVFAYEQVLKGMGVPEKQIKKDFFPGFA
jgi:ferredoxin-NADP reductase